MKGDPQLTPDMSNPRFLHNAKLRNQTIWKGSYSRRPNQEEKGIWGHLKIACDFPQDDSKPLNTTFRYPQTSSPALAICWPTLQADWPRQIHGEHADTLSHWLPTAWQTQIMIIAFPRIGPRCLTQAFSIRKPGFSHSGLANLIKCQEKTIVA